MKLAKIAYWVTTGLLAAMYTMAGVMYFVSEHPAEEFAALGFPTFFLIPLGILKIGGAVVLLTQKQSRIKEWAYAGITFNTLLAFGAHLNVNDGEFGGALVALVLATASYILGRKVFA